MPAVAAALRRAAAGRAPQGPLGLCFKGPNIRGPPRRGPRTLCTLSLQQQRIPTPHVFPLLSSSSCSSCCSSSWFAGVSFVGSPAVSSFLRSRGPPPKGGGPDGPLPFGFCYFSRGFASSSMRGAPMEDPPSPGSPSRAPQSAQAVHSSSSRADPGGPHWGSPSLGRARVGSPGPDEGGAPRGRFGGPWGSPPFPSLHSGGLMDETTETAMRKTALNCLCLFFCLCGVAFAFVPLYAAFCNATGYGGAIKGVNHRQDDQQIPNRQRNAHQHKMKELLTIDFASHCNLPWDFRPLQKEIKVAPGESALAFYRAKNNTDKPIIGMSVYHVLPPEAGQYFNKIQCFCFEEQMLNPHEEVDMPVFFFIDPAILDDPRLEQMRRITLSYVFFESESQIPEEYKHLTVAKPTTVRPPGIAI